jgi:hypothetical protein
MLLPARSRRPLRVSVSAVLSSFFLMVAAQNLALSLSQLLNPAVVSLINWIIKRGHYDALYLQAEESWFIAISNLRASIICVILAFTVIHWSHAAPVAPRLNKASSKIVL